MGFWKFHAGFLPSLRITAVPWTLMLFPSNTAVTFLHLFLICCFLYLWDERCQTSSYTQCYICIYRHNPWKDHPFSPSHFLWNHRGLCLLLPIPDTSFCEHEATNTTLYISLCCLAAAQKKKNPCPSQPLMSSLHLKFRVGQPRTLLWAQKSCIFVLSSPSGLHVQTLHLYLSFCTVPSRHSRSVQTHC